MVEVVNRQDHGGRKQEMLDQAHSLFKVMYSGLEVEFHMESADARRGGTACRPLTVISLRGRLGWSGRRSCPNIQSFPSIHTRIVRTEESTRMRRRK